MEPTKSPAVGNVVTQSPGPAEVAQGAGSQGGVDIYQFNKSIWTTGGGPSGKYSFVDFENPGEFITRLFPWLLTLAGMILFVMIVWGGFEIMMGANDPKSAENGKKRITSALIGFAILFAAFWIGQIMQVVFGINIGIGGQ